MPCSCVSVQLCHGVSVEETRQPVEIGSLLFSMWVLWTEPRSSGLETVVFLLGHFYNLLLMHRVLLLFAHLDTFQGDCLRSRPTGPF